MRTGSRSSVVYAGVLSLLVVGPSCRDDAAAEDTDATAGSSYTTSADTESPSASTGSQSDSTGASDTGATGTETGTGDAPCVDDSDCERGFVCESVCVEVTASTATLVVGPDGGALQVVGAGIEIPAGALTEPTEITLTLTDEAPPSSFAPKSAQFRLTPQGLRFAEPAEFWLTPDAVGPDTPPQLYSSTSEGSGYERLRTRADGSHLEAWIWHFSVFFAGDTFPSIYYQGAVAPRVGSDCGAPTDLGDFTRNWVFRVDNIPDGFEITRLDKDPGGIWVAGPCNARNNWPLHIEPGNDGSQWLYAAPYPGQSPELEGRFTLTVEPISAKASGQLDAVQTIIVPCWDQPSITESATTTVSRLDTCGCFDAVFSGEAQCIDGERGEVSCGDAWDWRTNGFNADCTLSVAGGTPSYITEHVGRDLLLDIAGLPGEVDTGLDGSSNPIDYPGEGVSRRCAILEQARTLCTDSPYIPQYDVGGRTDAERRQTRQALCQPGLEVRCVPSETPDYAAIAGQITTDPITRTRLQAGADELVDPPHNYCTGQVQGGVDGETSEEHTPYAAIIPAHAVPGAEAVWDCSEGDSYASDEQIEAALAPHGGTLLGMNSGGINGLTCPLKRALLECVAPNLGVATPCTTALDPVGSMYSAWPDYCFGFALGLSDQSYCERAGNENNAHCNGRAIDLNSQLQSDYVNDGNIVQCVASSDPSCTNSFAVPRLDLPPGFVAIVEGCGLQWLGRSNDAEGGRFGCDPMHFEVP